jgi:UDP-N-acetyl-D-mannosaminuronic acid dehydrogenase
MSRSKIAIVGGCGHVGLPLSIALAPHHDVLIYDRDLASVELVRSGRMPFMDSGCDEALPTALAGGMRASTSPDGLKACETLVVVIGTPVDEHLNPTFVHFDRVLDELVPHMRDGQTIVLRSTVYPGTTERAQKHLTERGLGIDVAFCPERVAQGKALLEIRSLPQLISAFTPKGFAAVRSLFGPLGIELIELTPMEAELAKLFNNVFRYVNFAVANQFYMTATHYNLDFYRILHALRHNYPRGEHLPGPGFAAGPCLFKDTMQVSAFNDNSFFLGHAAMLINEGLPQFVVRQMTQRWPNLGTLTVGLMGMAFKGESDDARESLSYKLKKILLLAARRVLTCDPYVRDDTLDSEEAVLAKSDIFVLGAPHRHYGTLDFGGKTVVDVWNLLGKGGQI